MNSVCISSGDLNDDGYTDVVASYNHDNYGYLYSFLSNGDCTFDNYTTQIFDYPLGTITVNDFDTDGYADLLIGEGYGRGSSGSPMIGDFIHVFNGNGNGSFTEIYALQISNIWITSGDLNDDGNPDLVISGEESSDCAVLVKLGNGDLSFQPTEFYEIPHGILHTVQILGDMDLDGNIDLGMIGFADEISFLYGNGDGTFRAAEVVAHHSAAGTLCFLGMGDFNEDGMPDMVASGSSSMPTFDEVLVWYGVGTYTYYCTDSIGGEGYWLDVRDYDMDGHYDVALSSFSFESRVIPGNGDGTFSSDYLFVCGQSSGLLSEDFDLDGDYDLIICEQFHSLPDYIRCYRNTTISLGVEEESSCSISDLILEVSPNPFSSSVTVSASGFSSNPSDLQIFDLSGRLVTVIPPAFNRIEAVYQWNGRSETGAELPDGIYSARLSSHDSSAGITLLKLE